MVAKKTAAKKAVAQKKTAAKKSPAKTGPAKKAAAKKTTENKAAAEKTAAEKTAVKQAAEKATAKQAAATAGTTGAKKAPVAKKAAKKAPAERAAARSTTTKKATAAKKSATAKQTGAKTVVAKKTVARAAASETSPLPSARAAAEVTGTVDPGTLAVRPGEDPWTPAEVAEARTMLMDEAGHLRAEIVASEDAISGLMRDSGDGAGDDQADVGTKNITREHEIALATNAREMLLQTEHALERLDNGTYGLCESCGNAIGKARMQAFPRATLCVECKQRMERR